MQTSVKKFIAFLTLAIVKSTIFVSIMRKATVAVTQNTPTSSAFWERIGSPRFISAPMVDQSNLAWRLLVRKNGANLAFSQMMHAKNFVIDKNYRNDCIDWKDYRSTNGSLEAEQTAKRLDNPLIVQLAGHDPDILVAAGRILENDVSAIDLNLGCPQKIAKRGNYGAYLLPNKELIVSLLTAMVQNLNCAVTAKIRRLPDERETIELAQAIEACGVQMLTVHGRTVTSAKQFTGPADWDIIRKIKKSVSIPVVANGGISCYDDAIRCLEYTGADAVMSSEALLENPKLFTPEGDRQFRDNFIPAQIQTAKEYLELVNLYPLPRPLCAVVRGHLFKMLYRFLSAKGNFDLREKLAEATFLEMQEMVKTLDFRLASIGYDELAAMERELLGPTTWYMRHRDENAQLRIISQPRQRIPNHAGQDYAIKIMAMQESLKSAADPVRVQKELKERLLEKFRGEKIKS